MKFPFSISIKSLITFLPIVLTPILLVRISPCRSQVVSHELRRLAISTNQFGIDALKALDKIEPPDKAIVFCPICISSSLMMIMMGSSKYQVVSSLRHALYVWSMKPPEINRGFRDIFEHIGLNQLQRASSRASDELNIKKRSIDGFDKQESSSRELPMTYHNDLVDLPGSNSHGQYLSLPRLMQIKEFLDKSSEQNHKPWWLSINMRLPNSEVSNFKKLEDLNYLSSNQISSHHRESKNTTDFHNTLVTTGNSWESNRVDQDVSQMSATSNIYLQRGLVMNYNYNLLLRQHFKTVIHPVDFVRNTEETRQHINSLVAANTEGKVQNLVRRENFERQAQPKIMIISTFHFRGTLDIKMKSQLDDHKAPKSRLAESPNEINEDRGRNSIDQSTQRKNSFIETQETFLKYGLFSELGCNVIEIPFNNRLVSLLIVMPTQLNSTDTLLTKLSAQILSDMISSLTVKKISVEIPIIKFDRGPVNMKGLIKELGLESIFFRDKVYNSETGLNKWMRPSDIVHETSIDIGTINPDFGQPEDRLKVGAHESRSSDIYRVKAESITHINRVKLDKPFFYFVLDSINGLILTMGRIKQ